MPIYDYKCHACGKASEFLISGSMDGSTLACPDCGSQNLERLLSTPTLLRSTKKSGTTCCGREERCEKPPCSTGERCRRH
jgi:putative FmdB family regulatory protein